MSVRSTSARSSHGWPIAILLAAYPALSGSERGALIPFLKLSDLVLALLVLAIVLRWGTRWRGFDRAGAWLGIYALMVALFTVINISRRPDLTYAEDWGDIASAFQYFIYYCCAFVFAQLGRIGAWIKATIATATAIALIAVLQFLDVGPTRELVAAYTGNPQLAVLQWNGTYRSTGLFQSWHTLEMYLGVALVMLIGLVARAMLSNAQRLACVVAAGLMLVGMASGLTVTPGLLVLLAIVYFGRRGRLARYLPIAFAAILITLVTTPLLSMINDRLSQQAVTVADLPPWLPQTIAYRLYQWQTSLFPVIGQNLWTGYGPLKADASSTVFQFAESQYVNVLLLGGIPLFLVFLVLSVQLVVSTYRVVRRFEPGTLDGIVACSGFLVAAGVLVIEAVHPYLQDSAGAGMFFGLVGVTCGLAFRTPPEEASDGLSAGGQGSDRTLEMPDVAGTAAATSLIAAGATRPMPRWGEAEKGAVPTAGGLNATGPRSPLGDEP